MRKLLAGQTSIGCFLGLGSPTVAELLAQAGFEWLMIETEHNAVDWGDVQQMLMAMSGSDVVPMVRLPSSDRTHVQRSLDIGAYGIMVPMIRSVEEVREVIAATRYPPHGGRGFGGLRAGGYTFQHTEYFQRANDQILVVLIIETKEALQNIDAIAAEPGVDVLMIGTFDLYLSLGLDPFQQPQPEGEMAVQRIVEAGRKFNRAIGGAYGSTADLRQRREQGFRMLAFTDYCCWQTPPKADWQRFSRSEPEASPIFRELGSSMASDRRMNGQRVLVTGAGTGIGRGIALELGKNGAEVVLHYSHSGDSVETAAEEIRSAGSRAATIQADFREFAAVERLAEEAVRFLGGIDVLVNNAGITHNVPIEEITPVHFETLFNVNVRAQMFLTKAVVPTMARQGRGVIINITSVHAFAGMTGHPVYAATKGAIVAFTREVALELIPKGIRVNAIAPGWVRVENQEQVLGADFDWNRETTVVPVGYAADPEDIARVVMFLCSDDSRFILGQTIIADGGQLAIMPLTGDFRQPRTEKFGARYVD
jgi:NAD(P)-dependent dehydrogenase (short-subunit alcohol dehydrogenase family)/2-keto-3-deoxy-L-rhamnonate aldolase RhmA